MCPTAEAATKALAEPARVAIALLPAPPNDLETDILERLLPPLLRPEDSGLDVLAHAVCLSHGPLVSPQEVHATEQNAPVPHLDLWLWRRQAEFVDRHARQGLVDTLGPTVGEANDSPRFRGARPAAAALDDPT